MSILTAENVCNRMEDDWEFFQQIEKFMNSEVCIKFLRDENSEVGYTHNMKRSEAFKWMNEFGSSYIKCEIVEEF